MEEIYKGKFFPKRSLVRSEIYPPSFNTFLHKERLFHNSALLLYFIATYFSIQNHYFTVYSIYYETACIFAGMIIYKQPLLLSLSRVDKETVYSERTQNSQSSIPTFTLLWVSRLNYQHPRTSNYQPHSGAHWNWSNSNPDAVNLTRAGSEVPARSRGNSCSRNSSL